jgi:uncharacterized protein (DUF924 family)
MTSVIDEVLSFWFGQDDATPEDAAATMRRWFVRDEAFDGEIRERFGTLVDAAIAGELAPEWSATPQARLAQILLIDQFTRNIHRGSARAFAGDARAQRLALEGIERGDDQKLRPLQRVFAYLPLEHAEDAALQAQSVALFEALADAAPTGGRDIFDNYADYARRHRDVIVRYGRFPHRNAALGRASTPDEQAWLDAGGGF